MPFLLEGFPDSSVGKESACSAGDPSSTPGLGRSAGEGIGLPPPVFLGFPVAKRVKNLPAMWDTWVRSPEKGTAAHSSYSSLENSMDCIVHGVAKSQT